MKNKLYFKNEDANVCMPLNDFLQDAYIDRLAEIELIEAVPDKETKEFVWCSQDGEVTDRGQCTKSECSGYNSKSGRGVCADRGKLYNHGKKVTFSVDQKECYYCDCDLDLDSFPTTNIDGGMRAVCWDCYFGINQ